MSGPRPDDDDPGVYTMPAETFRVGERPSAPSAPDAAAPAAPPSSPDAAGPRGRKRNARATRAERPTRDASTRPPRRRKAWDIVLTIVLVVVTAGAAVIASSYGLALAASAASCGEAGRVCRGGLREVGVWMAFTTPVLVLVCTVFFSVVVLVIRRRAFWVPLVGLGLLVALWAVGLFLVWAAV